MKSKIQNHFQKHLQILKQLEEEFLAIIEKIAHQIIMTLKKGKKILLCGNGGSAADCQHIAAELVVRYKKNRKGLPAIALTTDTSILTAIGNDYGFERIFERQVEAIGEAGDLLWCFSTSGNSENVLKAVSYAKEKNIFVVGFLGKDGGKIKPFCDIPLVIPHEETAIIQEMHIMISHILCGLIEDEFEKTV